MITVYNVIVTDSAFLDMQEAVSFLKNVSSDAVQKHVAKIQETILSLKSFPFRFESFGMPAETGYDFRRAVIDHRYILVYAVRDGQVVVERLLDARRGFSHLV